MSLPHVLLGMLSSPASGYELKQHFSHSVRHFWSAELSQIYPALAKLERDGLLTSSRQPSDKGPDRRIYARTRAGCKALRDWLGAGPLLRTERLGFLTQVFFLDEIPREKRIGFFEDLKADFEARAAELAAIEAQWGADDPRFPDALPDAELVKHMTLRAGLKRYQATIEWCDECLARLRARQV